MPLTVAERGIVRVVQTLYHLLLVRLVMFIPIVARFMSRYLSYKLENASVLMTVFSSGSSGQVGRGARNMKFIFYDSFLHGGMDPLLDLVLS